MNTEIKLRSTQEYKKRVEKQSKLRGFSNVSEYIRNLINNDKSKLESKGHSFE